MLLEEARERELPCQALGDYLDHGLVARNRWGTAMRAHSARAVGLFWQKRPAEAFAALAEAGRQETGLAGYGTLTLLSLANRCHEFGDPNRTTNPVWGREHNTSLVDGAATLATGVRDPQFREERIELVKSFRGWSNAATPDAKTVLGTLAGMADPDQHGLYLDHVTARWARPGNAAGRGEIKQVVLSALPAATALDTVLARLFGLSLARLTLPSWRMPCVCARLTC